MYMEGVLMKGALMLKNIVVFFEDIFAEEEVPYVYIEIPKDVLYRTELMCEYISSEEDSQFGMNEFIKILYLDFIRECVEHYNPKNVLKRLTTVYYDSGEIVLSNGTEECIVKRLRENVSRIRIEFDGSDIDKGNLILKEIYELYGYRVSFGKMIEQIWLGFINDYKTGDNKKAFADLMKKATEYKNENFESE